MFLNFVFVAIIFIFSSNITCIFANDDSPTQQDIPYKIPEIWNDINLRVAIQEIRVQAAYTFIKERKQYLEDVQRENNIIDKKLLQNAQEALYDAQDFVQFRIVPVYETKSFQQKAIDYMERKINSQYADSSNLES